LKKQKQLISFLSSYGNFVSSMKSPPGEREYIHFRELASIATRNFRKFYIKWRPKLIESLASVIMGLSKHEDIFDDWIIKYIRTELVEVFSFPDDFSDHEIEECLHDSVLFWKGLFECNQVFTESTLVQIYDEFISSVHK
jgi:hypothetical protein